MILETIYKCRVMKIINTLSVLFFLFIAVACSMEEDVINDIDKDVQSASEVYAALGVSLAADEVQTRSSEYNEEDEDRNPNTNENVVRNCYVAVFDNSNKKLLASRLYSGDEVKGEGSVYTLGKSIVFKVSKDEVERHDLIFVAVAHMNDNDDIYGQSSSIRKGIQSCSTYDGLMDFTLKEDPTVLVKVGELLIKKDEYKTYMNISPNMIDENGSALSGIKPIRIKVSQRSAAIQLDKFAVESKIGEVSDVEVKSLQLLNMVYSTNVGGSNSDSDIDASYLLKKGENGINDLLKYRFYTYENPVSNADKTKLRIGYSYKLNGKEETGFSTITIKSPSAGSPVEAVMPNHLYKLNVTVNNGVATATIQCSTNDWIEGGTIEIPVKESK